MFTITDAILNKILFFNFYFKRPSNKLRTHKRRRENYLKTNILIDGE